MEVRLLGPVTLDVPGGPRPIASRTARSLLACLALRAGQRVSVEVLTGWVWADDDLPEYPGSALQTVVSRLRRTLRDAGATATLETVAGGYVLRLPAEQVDALRFESQLAGAQESTHDGDPARVLESVDEALSLWAGDQALADVNPGPPATGEAVRLRELRLDALEERAGLLLRLRPPGEVLAELARLTSHHPLREGLARHYLRALDACGRRPEALEVYRRLAHTMNDELGVGPGPETRALHADLLAERPLSATEADTGPASTSDVAWPVRVGTPPALAAAFQVRAELRARIDAAVAEDVVVVTQVMAGDGGVGKTQLAAAIYHDALDNDDVDLGVWVTATSRDAVLAAYAAAYKIVHPPAASAPQEIEERAAAFLAWLAATERTWIVVLDDVADPADLNQLRPRGNTGRVLVTTRRRDAAMTAIGSIVDVGLFSAAESLAYLYERLSQPHVARTMLDGAEQLAADLGDLPLALAQAAAVIIDDGISCADYRDLLADRTLRLAEVFPTDPRASGDDYAHALPAAWSLATDRAAVTDPLVRPMLVLVAALDPNGIPEAVLLTPSVHDHLGADNATGARQARSAIRAAHRFSLLTHTPEDTTRSVRMHALAQRAALDHLTEDELARVVLAAADALLEAYPRHAHAAELSQVMAANTFALAERHPDAMRLPHPHPVLLKAALDPGQAAPIRRQVEYHAQLVARRSTTLGPDHPSTLDARSELADARARSGDILGALRDFEETLADQLRVLGPDHRDTLATRFELAFQRGEAGDAATASREFELLAADCLRVLGPGEPLTLAVRIDAAHWQGEAGDPAGAVRALEELLPETIRSGGTDGIGALYARHHLARARGLAGDPRGAVDGLTALVEHMLRAFGRSVSPATLGFRLTLAHWQGRAGDPATALAGLETLFADHLRVLGPDHRDTLKVRTELAYWRAQTGDVETTLAGYRCLLADLLRLLGPEHPLTVSVRNALAEWETRATTPTDQPVRIDLTTTEAAPFAT